MDHMWGVRELRATAEFRPRHLEGKWQPQEPHVPWHVKLPCQPGETKCSGKGWGECLVGDSVTESKLALLATGGCCFRC